MKRSGGEANGDEPVVTKNDLAKKMGLRQSTSSVKINSGWEDEEQMDMQNRPMTPDCVVKTAVVWSKAKKEKVVK